MTEDIKRQAKRGYSIGVNSGKTRGSFLRGCLKRGLTKPSSLVRELENPVSEFDCNFEL